MDYSLTLKLSYSLFSLNPKNMRWFNGRRIVMSLLLLPLFTLFLLVNRTCLFLDLLLFPRFRKQGVKEPVFIVAAPRSATTYLFHLLAGNKEEFTSFTLWEIIFAPSIIQKYFFLGMLSIDKKIGSPLCRGVRYIERMILGDFKHIHKIGLDLPEEDEAILLWNLSTIYLNFFYPDTQHFDAYFAFDDALAPKLRHRIMRYYFGCIQRHNYVFNRNGSKRFLSKNPAMMAKVKSLSSYFPDALVLNINRCPSKTIPSTIALNNSIYSFFTSQKATESINARTTDILIIWYKMANKYLAKCYPRQTIYLDFGKLVSGDSKTIDELCTRLCITREQLFGEQSKEDLGKEHTSRNRYTPLDVQQRAVLFSELPFLADYFTQPA